MSANLAAIQAGAAGPAGGSTHPGSRDSRGASTARTGASARERSSFLTRIWLGWEGPALLLITLALLSFGLIMVYSASAVMASQRGMRDFHFLVRQAVGAGAGIGLLVLLAQVGYQRLRLLAWPMVIAVFLLLLVLVLPGTQAIAPEINGARRWVTLGPVVLQPSELAKFALIVWTAALAVRKQERLHSLTRGLLPFLLVWGAVELLILLQPSYSAAAIVLLLSLLVVFAAGARLGHFLLLSVLLLPLAWSQVGAAAYRMRRILTFLEPGHDTVASGYQINQALIALGSGGPVGRGFGHGQQKFGFLPEPHNDFLFAMVGEEWGFLGVLAVVVLFTAFALVGYRIARRAPDLFGSLLAIGFTNLIVVQAMLHMGVNTALIPTTGVTLPFMSYGRSSLLVCLAAVGVLISIGRAAEGRPR